MLKCLWKRQPGCDPSGLALALGHNHLNQLNLSAAGRPACTFCRASIRAWGAGSRGVGIFITCPGACQERPAPPWCIRARGCTSPGTEGPTRQHGGIYRTPPSPGQPRARPAHFAKACRAALGIGGKAPPGRSSPKAGLPAALVFTGPGMPT